MSILVYTVPKGSEPQNNFKELTKNRGFIYWDNAKFKKTTVGDKVFMLNLSLGYWCLTEVVTNNIPVHRNFTENKVSFSDNNYEFEIPDAERWESFVKLKIIEERKDLKMPFKNVGAGCSTFLKNDDSNGTLRISQLIDVFNLQDFPNAHKILGELKDSKTKIDMYKYYLKRASKQDVTRTVVVNSEALQAFFNVDPLERDEESSVSIKYLPDGIVDNHVRITKKQDLRIFIDRDRFNEGDILFFRNIDNSLFTLEVISNYHEDYQKFYDSLENNFLLTNKIPTQKNNLFSNQNSEETELNYDSSRNQQHPLNQILYGPPGTGKTYSTITKALDILGIVYQNYEEAQELFQNELGKRIEFVTMHQSFSYEDFVQGLKPIKSESGEGIVFDYKNGVFKEICDRAYMDTAWSEANSVLKQITNKKTGLVYSFEDLYKSIKLEIKTNGFFRAKRNNAYFRIKEIDGDSMKTYTKDGKGKLFTLNKTTLKQFYDDPTHEMAGNNSDYYKGILINYQEGLVQKNNNKFSYNQTQNNIDDKFVIILDEINRANISRVFGELIALIEKDKRDGKLTVTLPSGEPFTVPSNLYIIGTMNTADKSIALVDIALRRRFEFVPMYPQPELIETLKGKISDEEIKQRMHILSNLNRIIRSQKSVDFEIGHSYFMNTDEELTDILNKQILPLLSEYFMYDLKKVKSILEKTQKDREGNTIESLGLSLDDDEWSKRGLLRIKEIQSVQPV